MWREGLRVAGEVRPVWAVLYRPPLTKINVDLQWRKLHGAIAVNAFVSIINPASSNIFGFRKANQTKRHLLICVVGEAKLSIYLSSWNRVESRSDQEPITLLGCNVRTRVGLDIAFLKQWETKSSLVLTIP